MPKRFLVIALNLFIVLSVAGGTAAYATMNKSVTLDVDGKSSQIRTFGSSVSDVLKAQDVTVGSRDRLSAQPQSEISDGDTITVKYAREVELTVDGETSKEVFHENTVERLLDSEGVDTKSGAYMSSEPDKRIPRTGMELVVSNPKKLTIEADGEDRDLTTAAPTVEAILNEADISVGKDDEVKPGLDDAVKPGEDLSIVRVKTETKTEKTPIKFETKTEDDSSMDKGETEVVTKGKDGEKSEEVRVTTADGEVREREVLESEILAEPVTQVEKRGTKEEAEAKPEVTGTAVWDRLAECESGGNWQTNSGNGYYGGVQFSAETWRAMGGSGLPHENSREEQIMRGQKLQKQSGWGQWPACSKKLGLN